MKYKILLTLTLFTSIGSIHSVSRATLNQITASYTGGTSPAKLQTLCRQLKGKNLAELADTSQAENFASHYKTPLADACSAAVAGTTGTHGTPGTVGSLATVTASENAYKAAVSTGVGVNAAAEKFFKDTIKYVEDGGPTSVLDATFDEAYKNVLAQHGATTTDATKGGAQLTSIQTSIEQVIGPMPVGTKVTAFVKQLTGQVKNAVISLNSKDPKSALGVVGTKNYYLNQIGTPNLASWVKNVVDPLKVAQTDVSNTHWYLSARSTNWGAADFATLTSLPAVVTALGLLPADLAVPAALTIAGFTYDSTHSAFENVHDSITAALAVGGGGGGGGGLTADQTLAIAQRDAVSTYLRTRNPGVAGGSPITGFAFDPATANALPAAGYKNKIKDAIKKKFEMAGPDVWQQTLFADLNTAFNAGGSLATNAHLMAGAPAFVYAAPTDATNPAAMTDQVRLAINKAYIEGGRHAAGGGPSPAQQAIINDAANLRTYLNSPPHSAGFTADATLLLVDEVTQLVTKVYENGEAAGVASVPAAPPVAPVAGTPEDVQADITTSIADLKTAVESHNAQITALDLPAIQAFCTTAAAPHGIINLYGIEYTNTAIQAKFLKKAVPMFSLLFANLHESATNLNRLQHHLNTTATDAGLALAPGDFEAIQNIHKAGSTGQLATVTMGEANNVVIADGTGAALDAAITAYPLP
jgi:hypothetical protein